MNVELCMAYVCVWTVARRVRMFTFPDGSQQISPRLLSDTVLYSTAGVPTHRDQKSELHRSHAHPAPHRCCQALLVLCTFSLCTYRIHQQLFIHHRLLSFTQHIKDVFISDIDQFWSQTRAKHLSICCWMRSLTWIVNMRVSDRTVLVQGAATGDVTVKSKGRAETIYSLYSIYTTFTEHNVDSMTAMT